LSFQGTDQSYRLFQSREFDRPSISPSPLLEPVKSLKSPGFLVRKESTLGDFFASIAAICSRPKLPANKHLRNLYRDASLTGFQAPGVGIANSLVLHVLLILAIFFAPMFLPASAPHLSAAFLPPEVLFYPVPPQKSPSNLPRIAPKGPGGRPGSGVHPLLAPEPGKSVSNLNLTAISKPIHPDNKHQTIIQPSSPPDLRIPNDVKIPNLSLGSLAQPKRPNLDLTLKKPMPEMAKTTADMATPVADTNVDMTLATQLRPTVAQPKMPIPSGTISRPSRRDGATGTMQGGEAPEIGVSGDGRALLALGIDPSTSSAGLAVPAGNRWGDFSIAPGADGAGAPGGRAGGVPGGGGTAGNGRAGDASVGIGPGHEGGGGGKDGSSGGSLSIKGSGAGTPGIASLDPHVEARMIYPVAISARLPRNRMVVSAGPMGGGGLGVYNALPCAKIYTIFLPMSDSSWTMQYCQKGGAPAEAAPAPSSTVIRMEAGLVPPDPDLDSRYDFKRLALPPGMARKLIVLKGTVREDGTVEGVEVYQGLVPQMDEAARLAFSRWKFRPAMRSGKPVALEVLVGISPDATPGS